MGDSILDMYLYETNTLLEQLDRSEERRVGKECAI